MPTGREQSCGCEPGHTTTAASHRGSERRARPPRRLRGKQGPPTPWFWAPGPQDSGVRLFEVTQFGACSGHHQTPRSYTKVSALRWCLFPGPGSQALGVPLSGSPGSPGGGSHQRFPSLTLELFVEQGLAPGQWAWPCTQRAQLRLQWGEWGRAPARRAPVSKFRGALPGGSWTAWLEGTPRAGGSAPPTDPN